MTDTRSALKIRKDVIAMTTQHTPGPYIIDADPDNEGFLSIYTATDGINAELAGKIGERSNADLFAAAPETAAERDRHRAVNAELVKAIEHALSHDDALKPEYQLPASLSWELREAIKRAKAKGE